MPMCKFCRIDFEDSPTMDLEVDKVYKCMLIKYLYFKHNNIITYFCDCNGNANQCYVLDQCKLIQLDGDQ